MRSLVLAATMLAGLLAVAAPTAQALCAVDEEGGCSRLRHTLVLDVDDQCPDAAALCIAPKDESLAGAPNEADWAFRIHNGAGSAITVELFAIGFYDPETGEPRLERVASQKLATIEVPAGQDLETDFATYVPGNVSHVRVQVLAEGSQAEADGELSNVRIMMMQPGGEVQEDPEPAQDDERAEDGKDAPAAPLVLLLLALAGAVLAVGFRRDN